MLTQLRFDPSSRSHSWCRMLSALQAPWPTCIMQLACGSSIALLMILVGQAASMQLHRVPRPPIKLPTALLPPPQWISTTYMPLMIAATATACLLGKTLSVGSLSGPLTWAVLVAPLGALTRWRLSKLNSTFGGTAVPVEISQVTVYCTLTFCGCMACLGMLEMQTVGPFLQFASTST